jgi:hypothetical protein
MTDEVAHEVADGMSEDEIVAFVRDTLAGVDILVASEEGGAPEVAWGDTFFSYDPDGSLPADRRLPFATIVTNDYPGFDEASQLSRTGVFRLNIWVSRETFTNLFPSFGDDEARDDFAALDTPLPHPIYGAQSWVSILCPGPATADLARTLLTEAHRRAIERYERRTS